jgi:hypothetical protein
MSAGRIGAVIVIFIAVSAAWAVLSGAMYTRSSTSQSALRPKVESLWGGRLVQVAPQVQATWQEGDQSRSEALVLSSSAIRVSLRDDFRRKGLVWYRTYDVEFDARYEVVNRADKRRAIQVTFAFPAQNATYDAFEFTVGKQTAQSVGATDQGLVLTQPTDAGATVPIRIHYKTRGLDDWRYRFGAGTTQVRKCTLTAQTTFARVDFPENSLSPTAKRQTGQGWELEWRFDSLVTGVAVGIEMPGKLDPGPWATRVSAFAPVGLAFFLTVLLIVGALTGRNLHPMQYAFVCAAFFAFHLLLAYLVDHIDVHQAFAISAACSVLLVVTYLMRAVGGRFTFGMAAPSQLVYLILFSYSFFYPGYTGLAITIGAILTLAILMQLTARVNWDDKFGPGFPPGDHPPLRDRPLPTRLVESRTRNLDQQPLPGKDDDAGEDALQG